MNTIQRTNTGEAGVPHINPATEYKIPSVKQNNSSKPGLQNRELEKHDMTR